MEVGHSCSTCSSSAELLCICSHVRLCRSCMTRHLTESQNKVHTFLPIQCEASIKSGDDHYTVVRRSQLDKTYKEYLRREIDSLESFKQRSLDSIQASANTLTDLLNTLITQKIEKLTRDIEVARTDAIAFADQIDLEQADTSKKASNIFFRNAIERNTNFKSIPCFKYGFEAAEYEEELQKFASFNVKCPAEPLFEISRTPAEFEDWLLVLKARKEEELKKQERKLSRLVGGAGSWNVSGPPTLDAFSFQVNCNIWLTGIGTGNGNSVGGTCSIQDIEIRIGRSTRGDVLYRHPETVTSSWDGTEEDKFFKVQFKHPVQLIKDTDYCLRVCYSAGGNIWSANGTVTTTLDGAVFSFGSASFDGGDNDNASSASSGPARDLYFALAEVKL
mmetsp:Transcript_20089/g.37315  ORF Transcript_20089/g.37315 Transcript_20089/m.37315 type:complete len:390 (+) Transcript_20089:3615-4784(+)